MKLRIWDPARGHDLPFYVSKREVLRLGTLGYVVGEWG